MVDLGWFERTIKWLWARRAWVLIALPAVAAGLALWGVCELFNGFKPFAERTWKVGELKFEIALALGVFSSCAWLYSSRKSDRAFCESRAAYAALQNQLANQRSEDEGLTNNCFVLVVRAILNSDHTLSIHVKMRNNSGYRVTIHGLHVDQLKINRAKNVIIPQILLGTPDEIGLLATHATPTNAQGAISVASDVPLDRAFDINIAASATIHRAKWSRLYFQMHDVQLEDSESMKIRKQEQAAE